MNTRRYALIAMFSLSLFSLFILIATQDIRELQKNDPLILNLACRQRTLTQIITKDLLLLHMERNDSSREAILQDLEKNAALFDKTQMALMNGGNAPVTSSPNGEVKKIPAVMGGAFVKFADAWSLAHGMLSHVQSTLTGIPLQEPPENFLDERLLLTLDAATGLLQTQSEVKITLLQRAECLSSLLSFMALAGALAVLYKKLIKPLRRLSTECASSDRDLEKSVAEEASRSLKQLYILVGILLSTALCIAFLWWINSSKDHTLLTLNMAGRQRMLSQRISKEVLLLHLPQARQNKERLLLLLEQSIRVFKRTQTALLNGGEVPLSFTPSTQTAFIPKTSGAVLESLHKAQPIAEQLFTPLQDWLKKPKGEPPKDADLAEELLTALDTAVNQLQQHMEQTDIFERYCLLLCCLLSLASLASTAFILRQNLFIKMEQLMRTGAHCFEPLPPPPAQQDSTQKAVADQQTIHTAVSLLSAEVS